MSAKNIFGFSVLALGMLAVFSPRIFMSEPARADFYAKYDKFYWGGEAPKDVLAAYSRPNRTLASFTK